MLIIRFLNEFLKLLKQKQFETVKFNFICFSGFFFVIKNGRILKETYEISSTSIYRTTAWISACATLILIWKGTTEGGTSESGEELEQSQDKAGNFDGIMLNENDLI